MATKYQFSNVSVMTADRQRVSLEGRWAGKYLVAVVPFDNCGQFSYEPLKNRGYVFGGKNASVIGNKWVMPFDTENDADTEIEILCEQGI